MPVEQSRLSAVACHFVVGVVSYTMDIPQDQFRQQPLILFAVRSCSQLRRDGDRAGRGALRAAPGPGPPPAAGVRAGGCGVLGGGALRVWPCHSAILLPG